MFSMDLVKWMSTIRDSTVTQNGAGPYTSMDLVKQIPNIRDPRVVQNGAGPYDFHGF